MEKTPAELCRELGIEESVDALVTLIHVNNSKAFTADCIRLAMAIGVGGHIAYEHHGSPFVSVGFRFVKGLTE